MGQQAWVPASQWEPTSQKKKEIRSKDVVPDGETLTIYREGWVFYDSWSWRDFWKFLHSARIAPEGMWNPEKSTLEFLIFMRKSRDPARGNWSRIFDFPEKNLPPWPWKSLMTRHGFVLRNRLATCLRFHTFSGHDAPRKRWTVKLSNTERTPCAIIKTAARKIRTSDAAKPIVDAK